MEGYLAKALIFYGRKFMMLLIYSDGLVGRRSFHVNQAIRQCRWAIVHYVNCAYHSIVQKMCLYLCSTCATRTRSMRVVARINSAYKSEFSSISFCAEASKMRKRVIKEGFSDSMAYSWNSSFSTSSACRANRTLPRRNYIFYHWMISSILTRIWSVLIQPPKLGSPWDR